MAKKSRKVNLDKLMDEIEIELKDYTAAVAVDVESVTKQLAKDTAYVVEAAWRTSGAPHAQTSEYGSDFQVTKKTTKAGRVSYVIHASADDAAIAHLLENGHAIVKGGRTVGQARAFPHFERGQKYAEREFASRIIKKIEAIK